MYTNQGGFGGFSGFDQGTSNNQYMGGFFPSPSRGGAPPSPLGAASRDLQGLMAVTVKMVQEQALEEGSCMRFHGGHEASLVELVGQVESTEIDQMFMKYVVDDGTGRIACKKFIDPEKSKAMLPVGTFVRVIGLFRRFGADNFITAHRVEALANLDEIARHRIEVVHTFVQLKSSQGGTVSAAGSAVHTDYSSSAHNSASDAAPMGQDPAIGVFLAEVQRVFGPRGPKYNPNVGVSRQSLHMHFLNQMPAKLIDEKIQFLHDEGHMFSTIDDNHFQLTFA